MKSFSLSHFLTRIIRYYRVDCWQMILAVALCAMVVSGSFIIGDSVDFSLRKVSKSSIGKIKTVLRTEGSWLTKKSVQNFSAKNNASSQLIISTTAYLAKLDGNGSQKINLYGIKPAFASCFNDTVGPKIASAEIAINKALADSLDLKIGDRVVLRYFKPTGMPGDAPFSLQKSSIKTRSLKVSSLISGESGGNFSLNVSQQLPINGFLDFDFLAELLEQTGRGNIICSLEQADLGNLIKPYLTLEDYGLNLEREGKSAYLRSNSVFISDYLANQFKLIASDSQEAFGYFVNSIESGTKSVPYSFVTGIEKTLLASFSRNLSSIIINEWTARKLNVSNGDRLKMSYYLPRPFGLLEEKSADFSLEKVISMKDSEQYKRFAPVFPGMENAESCSDWDPSLPINTRLIEDDDEEYWETYKSLPKAIVDVQTAKKLWGNRFGGRTLLYCSFFPELEDKLLAALNQEKMGFITIPSAQQKIEATDKALDFRGLFIGLGFFVIVSALLLVKLLFEMHIERRFQEMSVMSIIGFSSNVLRKLLFQEALIICCIGAPFGVISGWIYAKIQILLLSSVWHGALNFSSLELDVRGTSLLISLFVTIFISMIPVFFFIRKFLLSDQHQLIFGSPNKFTPPDSGILYPTIFLAFAFVTILATPNKDAVQELALFFIAGFALLYFLTQWSLFYLANSTKIESPMKIIDLAKRNCIRKFSRSQAVIRVLAFAVFLVIGISANHRGEVENPWNKKGGTGGFSIFGETAIPFSGDLFSGATGKKNSQTGLGSETMLIQVPVLEGSEASCFNLNSVKKPSVIGVRPEVFKDRFDFAWQTDKQAGWEALQKEFSDSKVIPAIADSEVIMWSLGLKQGSEIEFKSSNGEVYRLKFVAGLKGSIFQGMVLVSLDNFYRLWPESSGSRLFLTNSSKLNFDNDFKGLTTSLNRYGVNLEPASERLAKFNRVQNTYLTMFLSLGSIALLLGTVAIGILLNRNLFERKNELKTLFAIGFTSSQLFNIIFMEHLFLFVIGVFNGLLSAGLAIYPVLISAQGKPPVTGILMSVLVLLVAGFISLYVSLRASWKEVNL